MDEKYIWDFFLAAIQNPFGVAGLMGNLYAESGLRANDLEGKYEKSLGMTDTQYTAAVDKGSYTGFAHDSAGYGIAQWTYSTRKQALLDYANRAGVSISDLNMQMSFLIAEMKQDFKSVWRVLLEAKTVREASDAVMLKFEKPKNQSTENQERRAAFGQKYFDLYGGEEIMDIQKVIGIASEEIGYLEKATNAQLDDKKANAGSNNFTKYARDLDAVSWFNGKKQGYAWCAVFVTWCFYQAYGMIAKKMLFQPDNDNCAAGCGSARGYYNKQGMLFNSPAIGDQIFFWSPDLTKVSHTGLVIDVDSTRVYTIEGNTSDGSSVIANGGAVCKKNYALDYKRIAGYGRPDWSQKESGDAGKEEQKMTYTAKVQATNGGKVNLRSAPSVNGKVLCKVPCGVYVTAEDIADSVWAKCVYDTPDGESYAGYMMREFLTMQLYNPGTDDGTISVSATELERIYHAIGKLLGKE